MQFGHVGWAGSYLYWAGGMRLASTGSIEGRQSRGSERRCLTNNIGNKSAAAGLTAFGESRSLVSSLSSEYLHHLL